MSPSVLALLRHFGVPFVALVVGAGELGVPTGIPSEILLLLAGSYAVHSVPGLVVAALTVALADIIGTTSLHLAARGRGSRLLTRILHHDPGQSRFVTWGRRRFGGHDWIWIFVGRLLPIVRMPVTVSAAMAHVPLKQFFLGAVPASIVWGSTPLIVGYFFQADVGRIEARYAQISRLLIVAVPVLALAAGVAWWARRGGSRAADWRRGRAGLGLLLGILAVVYLVWVLRGYERTAAQGVAILSFPDLARQGLLVGLLAVTLVVLSGREMLADRHSQRPAPGAGAGAGAGTGVGDDAGNGAEPLPRGAPSTRLATAVWVALVLLIGVGIAAMGAGYPRV